MKGCGTFPAKGVGDRGQPYQVDGLNRETKRWEIVGWTDRSDGGSVAGLVRDWPRFSRARVVDRFADARVLSLWQPWASMLVQGVKSVETRSWKTDYRGVVFVHASLYQGRETVDMRRSLRTVLPDVQVAGDRGHLLGAVELVDVVPVEEVREGLGCTELLLGDYADGRFAWLVRNPVRFDHGPRLTGKLGLWRAARPELLWDRWRVASEERAAEDVREAQDPPSGPSKGARRSGVGDRRASRDSGAGA